MAFIHGKGTVVLLGDADLSCFFNEVSTSRSVETAESTVFCKDAKTYITGLQDGTMSLSGMFDGDVGAVDEELQALIAANAGAPLSVALAGTSTVGSPIMSMLGKMTSYEISAPVGDIVSVSTEMQADDGVGSAVSLHALSAETITSTGASVDNTNSTLSGGQGIIHVTANTLDDSIILKIQHSADNAIFADLLTFTTVTTTATTSERFSVAPTVTVNRYLRASWVTSPISTGSITFHINFTRR